MGDIEECSAPEPSPSSSARNKVNSHTTALVTLEAWSYHSPDIRAVGRDIDIGILCEALLYYDNVLMNVTTPAQLAGLLSWASASGHFDRLLDLVREGIVIIYDYSFITAPLLKDGAYSLINLQDPIQEAYGTFPRRFLYHKEIETAVPSSRRRKRIIEAFADRVIEAKADDFGPSIENARRDYDDPRRNALLLQAFVDDIYRIHGLGRPPEVSAVITPNHDGSTKSITWNLNLERLSALAGSILHFGVATPMSGGAICNRLLWSAAQRRCDLYLGSPMAHLVGDKLYETVATPIRTTETIDELKENVEFPNVRRLVNDGTLNLGDVLELRARANRFRTWLQTGADRDRDAIVAYHNEIAKESRFSGTGRKALRMFGVVGGSGVGSAVGASIAGVPGAAVGGVVGAGITFLTDLGSRLGSDWRPCVFGNWMSDRIVNLLARREREH